MNETQTNQRLDWNAKIVRFFFGNSRLVWLIILGLVIGGVVGLKTLKREGFPAVTVKVAGIQTIYPGATSSEVETKVTKEIESAIKDVKGVKDFSSVSQNSFSMVTVNFDEKVSIDQGVSDLQNKIAEIKGSLPKEAEQPKIMTWSTGGPAFVFAVTDGNDLEKVESEAKKLTDEIGDIKGVKKAEFEELDHRVLIELDSEKMQQSGVTLAAVNQILVASNVNFPVGILEADGKKESIVSLGAFSSMDDVSKMIVGFNPATKQPVSLKDIANISNKPEKSESIQRIGVTKDGKLQSLAGVLLNVEVTNDADIIKTEEAIFARIEDSKKDGKIDKDLTITPVYDQAKYTEDQIDEIMSASVGAKKNLFLLGGLQLLFLAMLLLVNWRAALISALSIPLSFGFTFIILALTGTQLNTLVLFSLVLVLGLIVDPAIVMIEAIQRYRDLNYSQTDAVIESGRRYGASLFMAVLTSLLVFLPFGVVSGYFGEIIRYIPLTVVPALLASYFVPMAILPYLTKKLLHKEVKIQNTHNEDENLNRAALFVMDVNRWVLKNFWHKAFAMVISLVLIAGSISLVATGKIQIVQFATQDDNNMLIIQTQYKKGLSFVEKDKSVAEIEKILLEEKSVKEFYLSQQTADGFMMFVNLADKVERKADSEKSKKILARVKEKVAKVSGFDDLLATELAMGPPQSNYEIKTQLAGNDMVKLESASKEVGKFLAGLEHVTKVDDGFTGKIDPEIQISLDRDKVSAAGLSSAEVGLQLKSLMDETRVGKMDTPTGNLEIFLSVANKANSISEIENLPLLSRTGKTIAVKDIAVIKEGKGVSSIEHYNGMRFASVQARVDDTKNTAVIQKKLDAYLTKEKLAELGIDSKLNKGDMGDITKSFTELGIALVIAIFLTYVVLVLQFKSFSLPTIMLFTIPLSFVGVFPALYLTGSQFGFLELLGVTILVGIVENVAIFLIDYANQLIKEKGLTPKEAIIQASGVRFRPILLTKLVALGGLLPLAIESDFWRGLSVVIIAGIGLSGFFSLVIIPILYVWIMNLRLKVHKTKSLV